MKPGAQWRVFVPPDLAYGDAPRPGIAPGSLLVFDMEFVKIEPPENVPLPRTPSKGAAAPAK
jgi:hypothetical protein